MYGFQISQYKCGYGLAHVMWFDQLQLFVWNSKTHTKTNVNVSLVNTTEYLNVCTLTI